MNLSEKNRNAKNCLKQIFKSEGCVKPFRLSREAISQVSEDPYLTEFVSWNLDYFSLFYFLGAKAPLRLAHVTQSVNPKKFQIAITEDVLA